MKLIYVAGPFRGKTPWDVAENVRRAERLALDVWKLGAAAVCPHLNTAHFDKTAPDALFLEGTLEMMRRCDAVVVVDGWEKSSGTLAELEVAQERGLPVFLGLESLRHWLSKHTVMK